MITYGLHELVKITINSASIQIYILVKTVILKAINITTCLMYYIYQHANEKYINC
jgi:hypothetical protein